MPQERFRWSKGAGKRNRPPTLRSIVEQGPKGQQDDIAQQCRDHTFILPLGGSLPGAHSHAPLR